MKSSNLPAETIAALGRIPSGMFILSIGHEKQHTGMLASWVQQCGFEPMSVVMAINRERWCLDWFQPGASVVVNILGVDQAKPMTAHFGKGFGPDEDAFAGLAITAHEGMPPILNAAHAYLLAEVTHRYTAGDHELVIAQVSGGAVQHETTPAVHVRKNGSHY